MIHVWFLSVFLGYGSGSVSYSVPDLPTAAECARLGAVITKHYSGGGFWDTQHNYQNVTYRCFEYQRSTR